MQKLIVAIKVFVTYTILLGIIYPFFVLGSGYIFFPKQSGGSLLSLQGRIIGSALIAQEFTSPRYFHSRLSTVGYDPVSAGRSNFALSNPKFLMQVKKQVMFLRKENMLSNRTQLPADIVLYSASGLDPHISVDNAKIQLRRVAKYRSLPMHKLRRLISSNIDLDFVGIWGQAGVNVLKLNLSLDTLERQENDNRKQQQRH